jgi:hypothetical protein
MTIYQDGQITVDGLICATLKTGKKIAQISFGNDCVKVCLINASLRSAGKNFTDFKQAKDAYKSPELKEMIALFEQLVKAIGNKPNAEFKVHHGAIYEMLGVVEVYRGNTITKRHNVTADRVEYEVHGDTMSVILDSVEEAKSDIDEIEQWSLDWDELD